MLRYPDTVVVRKWRVVAVHAFQLSGTYLGVQSAVLMKFAA